MLTEAEEAKRGMLLAQVLGLRKIRTEGLDKGRYRTTYGTKTELGLFRTIERIVLDGE